MKKHYTPNLEEFHVGLEYESAIIDNNWFTTGWDNKIVNTEFNYNLAKDYPSFYRVKYLNENDLIELGWNKRSDILYASNERDILTLIEFSEDKGWLLMCEESFSKIAFKGRLITRQTWIKNKSEMRKLMGMLNIKTAINKNEQQQTENQ